MTLQIKIIRVFDVNGKQSNYFLPMSIKINQFYTFLMHTRHRFRKFLPFLERTRSETENFHGHGPDLVTRYKKETGYRIKASKRY
ncbi:hypothetical protein ALC62_01352 [Cyphomyrmex costatus]|uniref:Uncharacterized protein n=1 Tax=Cyphomyrmex costatus TaxID=456900 RepID=A0A151IPD6_9HYME|nr:hypothetical protein ALC62_01352 [Cyphomyrmex costatus]